MKRFWQEPTAGLPSPEAVLGDGSSLSFKRSRQSTSPGELCLEGDLESMASAAAMTNDNGKQQQWTRVDHRHWVSKRDGALLERQFRSPMTLILYLNQHAQVHLEFSSRNYPHEPPTITKVVHPFIRHVTCMVKPPAMMRPFASDVAFDSAGATTIVYDQWSPVCRLDDLLAFLVDALKQHSCCSSHERDLGTPTLLPSNDDDDEVMGVEDWSTTRSTLDVHQELSPNRFDRGYPKTNSRRMEVGTVETVLMNSDSY